jgi:ABC-type antimicrobial peptide transport system permease subunit
VADVLLGNLTAGSVSREIASASSADVLSPDRVNAFVFSGFAGIALLIAVVGVAGVLAFSVSARTREFGVRLAIGSAPRRLLASVLTEGVQIAAIGIAAGAAGGFVHR